MGIKETRKSPKPYISRALGIRLSCSSPVSRTSKSSGPVIPEQGAGSDDFFVSPGILGDFRISRLHARRFCGMI